MLIQARVVAGKIVSLSGKPAAVATVAATDTCRTTAMMQRRHVQRLMAMRVPGTRRLLDGACGIRTIDTMR